MFFSVGLTHPDNIHQQFHAGGLFQRAGARSQGACTFARLARAHARTPASYPSEGNSALDEEALQKLYQNASQNKNDYHDVINKFTSSGLGTSARDFLQSLLLLSPLLTRGG